MFLEARRTHVTLVLRLSDTSLACWKDIHWKKKYQDRKYIAFKRNILAIGARGHRYHDENDLDYSGDDENDPDYSAETDAVDLYNTETGDWTSLPRMNEPRSHHSLVSFQGKICAVGGYKLRSSECFNPNARKWTYLPRLNIRRQSPTGAELKGELYVIGGKMATAHYLTSVEKYNPDFKTWVKVASMNAPRSGHAAGVLNGKIYVIGGGSDLVEAYDPLKNVWEIVDKVEESKHMKFTAF